MSDAQGEVVVSVRDVYKSFGDNHVHRGVSLDLHRDETLVLLGPSGTGKSVLIKMIVALLTPDRGEIRVFGEDIHQLPRKALNAVRVRMGFSFQHSALYDSMTVAENLAFPLEMNRPELSDAEIAQRVTAVLDAVGLPKTRKQMPASLSGGQRKRIGVARSLIMEPEIMLYDEPTAGLDPVAAADLNDLIVQVQHEYHTASIVITHDLASAKAIADRVLMLFDGKVFRSGSFDEIFESDDPRVRAFYDYNFTDDRSL
ncbi:MAG: ABC transporter ATP-binding protein [Myxococcota bacterium]